jgi:hypothetical protein
MALLGAALARTAVALLGAGHSWDVVRRWELGSGASAQLARERRAELVSTALGLGLALDLAAWLLFVFQADRLSVHFTGAMCAVGTLGAHPAGWWALGLATLAALGGAAWLVLDALDQRAPDLPLTRVKAAWMLALAPLALAASAAQAAFLTGLDPAVRVSCCSSLVGSSGGPASVTAPTPETAVGSLALAALVAGLVGWAARRTGRGAPAYAAASGAFAVAAIAAILGAIGPWVYEHPGHHCPLCLLQWGHGSVGYLLYLPLGLSLVAAGTAAALSRAAETPGLAPRRSGWHGTLVAVGLVGQLTFLAVAVWLALRSNLVVLG